jgi:hypothetical protein
MLLVDEEKSENGSESGLKGTEARLRTQDTSSLIIRKTMESQLLCLNLSLSMTIGHKTVN